MEMDRDMIKTETDATTVGNLDIGLKIAQRKSQRKKTGEETQPDIGTRE